MKLIKKVSEYKIEIIRMLFADPSNATSGEVWKYLIKKMGKASPSRASVIFYLNDLAKWGYLKVEEATGKGGIHRVYYLDISNDEFTDKIYKDTQEQLDQLIKQMIKN